MPANERSLVMAVGDMVWLRWPVNGMRQGEGLFVFINYENGNDLYETLACTNKRDIQDNWTRTSPLWAIGSNKDVLHSVKEWKRVPLVDLPLYRCMSGCLSRLPSLISC
jgi:hypothetical protein